MKLHVTKQSPITHSPRDFVMEAFVFDLMVMYIIYIRVRPTSSNSFDEHATTGSLPLNK